MRNNTAPVHTFIMLVMLFTAILGIIHNVISGVETLMPQERRCPTYLEEKASIHINDVEEFYHYVCTVAEANDVPAEWLLAAIHYHCRFNADEKGILAITDPNKDVYEQLLSIDIIDVGSIQQFFRLTTNVDTMSDSALLLIIKSRYPTAFKMQKQ